MNTRTGCLGVIALWAAYGVSILLTGGFGEDGGGKFASIGLFGVALFVIASAIESLASWVQRRNSGDGG